MSVQGLGIGIRDEGSGSRDLVFRGLGARISGLRNQGLGLRVQGLRLWDLGLGIWGLGMRVQPFLLLYRRTVPYPFRGSQNPKP